VLAGQILAFFWQNLPGKVLDAEIFLFILSDKQIRINLFRFLSLSAQQIHKSWEIIKFLSPF